MSKPGFTIWELLIVIAIVMALVLLLVLPELPGPDRPLSRDQVDQLKKGMSEEEVMQILGPPSEPLDLEQISRALKMDGRGWRWRSGKRKLEVYMIDGKMAGIVNVGF